ncbi:hypothetical protein [Thermococcus sp.]
MAKVKMRFYVLTRLEDEEYWTYTGDYFDDIDELCKSLKELAKKGIFFKVVADTPQDPRKWRGA